MSSCESVPPMLGALSTRQTFRPACASSNAARIPVTPAPTTSTVFRCSVIRSLAESCERRLTVSSFGFAGIHETKTALNARDDPRSIRATRRLSRLCVRQAQRGNGEIGAQDAQSAHMNAGREKQLDFSVPAFLHAFYSAERTLSRDSGRIQCTAGFQLRMRRGGDRGASRSPRENTNGASFPACVCRSRLRLCPSALSQAQ